MSLSRIFSIALYSRPLIFLWPLINFLNGRLPVSVPTPKMLKISSSVNSTSAALFANFLFAAFFFFVAMVILLCLHGGKFSLAEDKPAQQESEKAKLLARIRGSKDNPS